MYLFMSILLKFGPFHLENESRNKKKKKKPIQTHRDRQPRGEPLSLNIEQCCFLYPMHNILIDLL